MINYFIFIFNYQQNIIFNTFRLLEEQIINESKLSHSLSDLY